MPSAAAEPASFASDRMIVLLVLFATVFNAASAPLLLLPTLALGAAFVVRERVHPLAWVGLGVLVIAVAAVRWTEFEDHVFFGAYQLIAVGIAMTRSDVRRSLFLQLRWLVGALFSVAVAWKVASSTYRSGDLFRTVLLVDSRFDLLTRVHPDVDLGGLTEDRATYEAMSAAYLPEPNLLVSGAGLSELAIVLAVWTLVVEVGIAVSFLAPDGHRLARLRHPSLLAFGLTTYPVIPVLGFAISLSAVGLLCPARRPWVHWLYIVVITAPMVRGLVLAY